VRSDLAQQPGVGYAAPGTWPCRARDWHGGRVVFPHPTPDGCLVNPYSRAVGTAKQVPKVQRHDHLPGAKGYCNATALQAGAGPLWVCEGAFDALALLAAGVARVVALCGVQGWRWDWVREVRALVFALDADVAGQQQWRQLARQAALRGKQVTVLPAAAYGGCKDVSDAWAPGCWLWAQGLQQRRKGRPSRCLRTSASLGRSVLRSWSLTAASRTRTPSAWYGWGSRPQTPYGDMRATMADALRVTVVLRWCPWRAPPSFSASRARHTAERKAARLSLQLDRRPRLR
jgi:hypothetical protein